jgi:ABC-type phosphate/phosphonate transport system substrate-binding protein
MTDLRSVVRLVATPCYDLPGCAGPLYCSFIVVAADRKARDVADLRGGRAAINGWNSQSGMNALRAVIAPVAGGRAFFRDVLVTGAHRASLGAIRSGAADIAAIDCVTYGLLAAHAAEALTGTRVLCRSPAVPGLPLVTAAACSDDVVRRLIAALADVMADDRLATARAALHVSDIAALSMADYAPILAMADGAAALGYPVLC